MRTQFLAPLLALLLILTGCTATAVQPPPPPANPLNAAARATDPDVKTVRVGYIANGPPAGIGYVLEEGQLFQSQKLNVAFQRYASADGLKAALTESTIDIAIGLPLLYAAKLLEEDTPVAVVSGLQRAEEQVLVPVTSTVKSYADLKGKTIGTAGPGAGSDLLARTILSTTGDLQPAEYKVITGTETQLVLMLETHKVDAAVLRGLTIAGLPNASSYRVLGDTQAEWHRATASDAPPFYATVTMRQGFIDGYPDDAVRATAAIIAGVRWGQDNPAAVQQLMMQNLRMTQVNAANYAKTWSSLFAATLDDPAMHSMTYALERYQQQGLLTAAAPQTLFQPALFRRALELVR